MSLKRVRMPFGGPPSIIARNSVGTPTDMSCCNDGGLDSATYVASHRNSSEKKRGNFQWKIMPGAVVVPCNVWIVLAVLMVAGSCSLLTRSEYTWSEPGSCTSTRNDRCERCAWIAIQPHLKSHRSHSSLAPPSLCSAHGQGGKNLVCTPSSLTIKVGNFCRTLTPLSLSEVVSSGSRSMPTIRPVLGTRTWKPNSVSDFDSPLVLGGASTQSRFGRPKSRTA